MKRSTQHWTTAIAAAALLALPVAGYAQAPASPQTQPPTESAAPQSSQSTASSPAEHVREAKQAVSSIDSSTLPASAKPKIAQLRSHLNKLEQQVSKESSASATPSARAKSGANWGTEVAAIDKILTDLIGPESGSSTSTAAPTATTGQNAAEIDPTTKDKLREVRKHITALAGSMSGTGSNPAAGSTSSAASSDTMGAAPSPSAATPSPSPETTAGSPNQSTPEPTATPSTSTQSTQPSSQPAQQPPQSAGQAAPSSQPTQVDAQAAKQHLSEARESLSQLAGMPEASRLQGEARNQVSQLIANFNELITTQSEWKSAYAKVETALNTLLAPEGAAPAAPSPSAEPNTPTGTTGTAGAPGSPAASATSGSGAQLDPAIRAKLEEFRTHLKQFEQAAGGKAPSASAAGSMSPSVNTSSTTNPATPAPESASQTSNPTAAASNVPGATPAARPASPTSPEDAAKPSSAGVAGATGTTGTMSVNAQAQQHLDAIADILSKAKDGKLDKEQTEQIKTHVDQLRQLLK
jgi:hypothetical protein